MPSATHDSIANYLTRQGVYGVDPGTTSRPSLTGRLSERDIQCLYLSEDLARRIVDEIVDDAIRGGFRARDWRTNEMVYEAQPRPEHSADEEDPDFGPEDEPLDIPGVLDEVCKAARLYGTAHALIVNGDSDMSTPLDPQNAGEIFNLIALDRWECTPETYVVDPRNKRFARPETFYVTPTNNGGTVFQSPRVHYSRLIRFDGNKLPRRMRLENDDSNDSVLQVVWDALRRFLDTETAIATIVQRFETASIKIGGLNEALTSDDEGHDLIQQRMDLIHRSMSMLNAALLDADAGEEYQRAYASVTGLDTIWDRLAHSVAKAAKMPMTQLFGMSPSGLSTDDEAGRANWRKQVASYQKDQLRPRLEYLFSILNGGQRVYVEFPPLDESTAKEAAEIDKMRAETEQIRIGTGVQSREEVREDLKDEGKIVDRPDMEPEDPAEKALEIAKATAAPAEGEEGEEGENGKESPENKDETAISGKEAPDEEE
jgi:hypothetical protein